MIYFIFILKLKTLTKDNKNLVSSLFNSCLWYVRSYRNWPKKMESFILKELSIVKWANWFYQKDFFTNLTKVILTIYKEVILLTNVTGSSWPLIWLIWHIFLVNLTKLFNRFNPWNLANLHPKDHVTCISFFPHHR